MSVFALAVPVIEALVGYLNERKGDVARTTGLSEETVGKVSDAVTGYLTQDERATQAIMAEIDKAREHDAAMSGGSLLPVVALLRGLVRPVITLTAFFWYVYARAAGVPMGPEDYAIVGGVLAFWFGFRPFEKGSVAATPPARGSGATGGR